MHVFTEEGLRNFFDIIAITYEKGAKSSLYRALPDITSNRRYMGSPPCQQISSSSCRPFRYSGPRYIGPPTVLRACPYPRTAARFPVHNMCTREKRTIVRDGCTSITDVDSTRTPIHTTNRKRHSATVSGHRLFRRSVC